MLPTGLGRGATFPSFVPSCWLACICVPFFPPSDHPGRAGEEDIRARTGSKVHRLSARCPVKPRPRRQTKQYRALLFCLLLSTLSLLFSVVRPTDFGNTATYTAVLSFSQSRLHDIEFRLIIKTKFFLNVSLSY